MMCAPETVPRATPPRPTRFLVLAIFNFGFALGSALWAVALVAGLASASAAGVSGGGMATVLTVAVINVTHIILLVTGGIGLLRSARWGWFATVGYGVLAIGEAVILLATGAPLTFVVARLIYPVAVLTLLTTPVARKAAGI